ncbi:MAG: DUF5615 family PIN-like protein [Chloroflexi bacterium]|nr:DUF5615 family PIN-like protein [Chloroflexota bacterium]
MLPPRLVIEKSKLWNERQRAALAQEQLALAPAVIQKLRELEQIPWNFSYRFVCDDGRCSGHELQVIDWEIGQSYRKWSRTDPTRWREMIRQRYEDELQRKTDLEMRVLLDENVPIELADELPGHEVVHVNDLGWKGISNGELLRRADEAHFDALVNWRQPSARPAEPRPLQRRSHSASAAKARQ